MSTTVSFFRIPIKAQINCFHNQQWVFTCLHWGIVQNGHHRQNTTPETIKLKFVDNVDIISKFHWSLMASSSFSHQGTLFKVGGGIPALAKPPLKWRHGWVNTSRRKHDCWYDLSTTSGKVCFIPVKLPWIFPEAPLTFNEAPRNIQGNLTGMMLVKEALSLRPPLLSCFKIMALSHFYIDGPQTFSVGAETGIFWDN